MKRSMRWTALALLVAFPGLVGAQPPYEPEEDTLIAGKVVQIIRDSTRPEDIRVEVVTPHGDTLLVHLGPGWFLEQRFHLRAGDTLLIEGSLRPGEMVARRIRTPHGDVSVELRNEEGFPLWMGQANRNRYRPEREDTLRGRVVRMREVLPPRGFYPHIEVEMITPHGDTVPVMLGPAWMVRERVRIGDSLRLVASPMEGMGEMGMRWMARMMENMETHERMMFRDRQGMPMWDERWMDGPMGQPMGPMGPGQGPMEGQGSGMGGNYGRGR